MVRAKKPDPGVPTLPEPQQAPRGNTRRDVARMLQSVGLARLQSAVADPTTLSVADAAALLRVGAEIERTTSPAVDRPPLVHTRGRISTLDDPTWNAIIFSIENGASYEQAAAAAGVSGDTVRIWKHRGREVNEDGKPSEPRYAAFLKDCTRAKEVAIFGVMGALHSMALAGDSKAAAEWLKRQHPTEYGDRLHLVSDDELLEEARAMARELGMPESEAEAILATAYRLEAGE